MIAFAAALALLQVSPPPAVLDTVDVDDGLPAADVRAVLPLGGSDAWFGTRGGLALRTGGDWRYWGADDGLAGGGVSDLARRPDGRLVATGPGGFASGSAGEARWRPTRDLGGIVPNVVFTVRLSDDGVAWFGANGGAVRWDGEEWRVLSRADGLPHAVVHDVYDAPDGRVWIACRRGLAEVTPDGRVRVHHPELNVRSILPDGEGGVWFGTSGGAIHFADGVWRTLPDTEGLQPVMLDGRGRMWARSDADGVHVFEERGHGARWRLTTEQGLPSDAVYDVAEAPDRDVWIATGAGVVVWKERA